MKGVGPILWNILPFGAHFEYYPISPKDQTRRHQFDRKVLPGIFFGYALIGRIWTGDVLVADMEDLEKVGGHAVSAKTQVKLEDAPRLLKIH